MISSSDAPSRGAVRILSDSGGGGTACLPPQVVHPSVSVCRRDGYFEREFLRDHPAHRDAEHVASLDFQRVEQRNRIVREHLRLYGIAGLSLCPGTAIVVHDRLKMARQLRTSTGFHVAELAPSPMIISNGSPAALNFVMEFDVAHLNLCHRFSPCRP